MKAFYTAAHHSMLSRLPPPSGQEDLRPIPAAWSIPVVILAAAPPPSLKRLVETRLWPQAVQGRVTDWTGSERYNLVLGKNGRNIRTRITLRAGTLPTRGQSSVW